MCYPELNNSHFRLFQPFGSDRPASIHPEIDGGETQIHSESQTESAHDNENNKKSKDS